MTTLLGLAALLAAVPGQAAQARLVRLRTADGWTLGARYQAPRAGRSAAILVHGAAAGKSEWAPLQDALARRGLGSLALDLRGHGDSRQGPSGEAGFEGFDASGEWPRARRDIEAAAAFLRRQGIPARRIGCVGASIGANLASAARPAPAWLVLLSPGADYRGVRLAPPSAGLPVLAAASPADRTAFETARAYAAAHPAAEFLPAAQGHGAQMLADPAFLAALVGWVERRGP